MFSALTKNKVSYGECGTSQKCFLKRSVIEVEEYQNVHTPTVDLNI